MKTLLHQLYDFGQSPWLDYISRLIINKGHLQRMINQGVVGVTSNPTIFEKAIHTGHDYDSDIQKFVQMGESKEEIYEKLAVQDVRDACDLFLPVYNQSNSKDGYVSLEVNPHLAYDTEKTIQEAEELFQAVNHPNLMIKVPATEKGFPAIEALLSHGINVNITLIFSLEQYIKSASSYLKGIEKAMDSGKDLHNISSVASIFVSRLDSAVDLLLEKMMSQTESTMQKSEFKSLFGKAAIANSHLIYQKYAELFSSDRFKKLSSKGANLQRVLWASTSTKNPDYSDVKYVHGLIAKNTVNTMPEDTIEAFLDHGKVEDAIPNDFSQDQAIFSQITDHGIVIDKICQQLLQEGVEKFIQSFESLLDSIEQKQKLFQAEQSS
ncbi:MAG: transaldolase [Candidatus Atribacteria bacterium]|nr:transaldolase [Candidatus Atribacteria bacterium]